MTKITADHLARGAFVYIRQSTSYQLRTIRRAEGWSSGRVSSARPMFALSTMISVDLAAESFGRVSRSCSPQFAGVESARCCRSRHPDWRAMDVIGTRCWSFAVSSRPSSSTKTASMTHACLTIGCCSG